MSAAPNRPTSRQAFAAVTVVPHPHDADVDGGRIDWDSTMAERRWVWSSGLGVAEVMDTAQRTDGLSPRAARELTRRTLDAARETAAPVVVGVTADALPDPIRADARALTVSEVAAAVVDQLQEVEALGGRGVIMASRQLRSCARTPDDYQRFYAEVLGAATRPVVVHWLGPAFDPNLTGYWGSDDLDSASSTLLSVLEDFAHVVEGVKVSVLDADRERRVRAALPPEVVSFTGDDFHYVDLIAPDSDGGHSHALLGALTMFPHRAADALRRLDRGDVAGYRERLGATEVLSRHVFSPPTRYYKAGISWLAYLDGRRPHFRMLGGLDSARSLRHLAEVHRLAEGLDLFRDPDAARARVVALLALHGLDLPDLDPMVR